MQRTVGLPRTGALLPHRRGRGVKAVCSSMSTPSMRRCSPPLALNSSKAPAPPVLPRRPYTQLQPLQRVVAARGLSGRRGGGDVGRSNGSSWNPVEVVKREQGLQSNRLPADLKEKVEGAVESLDFRVTAGDVAAKAGVKLADAESALQALAYDSNAALEVSSAGDVVYSFNRGFASALRARSLLLSARPVFKTLRKVGAWVTRALFGTTLIASIAAVWLAIAIILSSGRSRDDRRDNYGYGGGYYNRGGGMRLYVDVTDLLLYLNPRYRHPRNKDRLSFIDALFSFVFGDGDPNEGFDDARWAALGLAIQKKGGVVSAEEMAPFLDPPGPPSEQGASGTPAAYADESFVLPALLRFGGEPFVDERTGALLYRFPALQRSGVTADGLLSKLAPGSAQWGHEGELPTARSDIALEKKWELTAASPGQVAGTVTLGIANIVGVAFLTALLGDYGARQVLLYNGLGWIASLLPAFGVYATAFFAIPAWRWFTNQGKNGKISQRNSLRTAAARLLTRPPSWLRRKQEMARSQGERVTLRQSDMIYNTDQDTGVLDIDEWDRRMQQKQGPQQQQQQQQPYDQYFGRQQQQERQVQQQPEQQQWGRYNRRR